MKMSFIMLVGVLSFQMAQAQLKTTSICPTFAVDVLEGTVNDLPTNSTIGEIEKKFPCFENTVPETNGSSCGGVYFQNKGIFFYTERDYIEVRENFKGSLSLPLFGAGRNSLFKLLGYPLLKDINWDAFQTKYGILILYYNKAGKINKIQLSSKNTETLKLCE